MFGFKICASDPNDFDDILACLEDKQEGGNPERFPVGCSELLALRDLSQIDEDHWQKTFPKIAEELGIRAACSTLKQVFHSQHQIFRRKPACKPSLSME